MKTYIAFLRAVNVGGTGKLPMQDLKNICADAGFENIQTYIASGNVIFSCANNVAEIRSALEGRLQTFAGKPVGVIVRTVSELRAILECNPFADKEPSLTLALLLEDKPPTDTLAQVVNQTNEEIGIGKREIYVYYANGIGRSRLRIPAAKNATARNMNTLLKMVKMAAEY